MCQVYAVVHAVDQTVVLLAVVVDEAVTEVEEEGDEAGGGDDGEDEEGGDVGRPGGLSLDCGAQLVTQITVATPHNTGSRLSATTNRGRFCENIIYKS